MMQVKTKMLIMQVKTKMLIMQVKTKMLISLLGCAGWSAPSPKTDFFMSRPKLHVLANVSVLKIALYIVYIVSSMNVLLFFSGI